MDLDVPLRVRAHPAARSRGLRAQATFTIYDSADQRTILKRIIKELDADTLGFTPASAQAKISKLKNELADVETFGRNANMNDPQEVMFLEIFRQYTRRLRARRARLRRPHRRDGLSVPRLPEGRGALPAAVPAHPRRRVPGHEPRPVLAHPRAHPPGAARDRRRARRARHPRAGHDRRRRHIPGASLTVVGDSDQSIYAFRGADIRNISEFERDFTGAKVVLLEQNYRSTQNILSAANAVISNNFDRKEKKLWTADGDGDPIIGFTGYTAHDEAHSSPTRSSRCTVPASPIATLPCSTAPTRRRVRLKRSSCARHCPTAWSAARFYERAEIKDAMAYLIAVANPLDELALRRILNTPKRGIGPVTETALASFAEQNELSFREAMRAADGLGLGPKVTAAITRSPRCSTKRRRCSCPRPRAWRPAPIRARPRSPTCWCSSSSARAARDRCATAATRKTRPAPRMWKNWSRRPATSTREPRTTFVDFLTQVSLVAAADEIDDASGTVSLMTLHTAKGLEYHAVFLTGLEEGLLPHQMSASEPGGPAEERRLFYVGITRARKRLHLSLAMSRAQFGEVAVAMPSRYLQEIPEGLIDWRQSPGMATSRGGTQPRALNARRPGGAWGTRDRDLERFSVTRSEKPKTEWANRVTGNVRDNGDLTSRPATASATPTSARAGSPRSPARARSASRT